jgi:hypothetical protein
MSWLLRHSSKEYALLKQSISAVPTKQQKISKTVLDLLLPSVQVNRICDEIVHPRRERIYTPAVVIWMFITQVLAKDHSCQQAVTRLNSWRVARGLKRVSSDTTSYCQARIRLPEKLFTQLVQWTAGQCGEAVDQAWLFHGRVVEMVDGWTVTMADTVDNQREYPQPNSQKPGCGFPMARLVGLFSLATGAIHSYAIASYAGKQTGETSLLRTMLHRVLPGRILLADRYYATFWLLAMSETRSIDLVARVHHLRKVDFRKGMKLGRYDQLVCYQRPQRPKWMSEEEYQSYPKTILVRHLRYRHSCKGFRTREVTLATTLDWNEYSVDDLAELYRRRWEVELNIRSLKTQMQMEHLRCKRPSTVRKEISCHMIGYNIVRATMAASALTTGVAPHLISFTGAMQAIDEFAASLRYRTQDKLRRWQQMLEAVAEIRVGHRPGRVEPREIKRRQKSYKYMTTPRRSVLRSTATAA